MKGVDMRDMQFIPAALLYLWLLVPQANAAELNLWPVDEEQNQRLDALEKGQAEILAKIDALFSPMTIAPDLPSDPAPPRRAISASVAVARKYIPQGRSVWTDGSGGVTDSHLAGHGYDPAIFANNTYQEKLWLHGDAHENRRKVVGTVAVGNVARGSASASYTSSQVLQTSDYCPSGNCPTRMSTRYQSTFRLGKPNGPFAGIGRALSGRR